MSIQSLHIWILFCACHNMSVSLCDLIKPHHKKKEEARTISSHPFPTFLPHNLTSQLSHNTISLWNQSFVVSHQRTITSAGHLRTMSAPDMTVSSKSAPSSAKIWSVRGEQQKISRMFHTCSESKASHHKMEDPSLEKHLQSSSQRHHCQHQPSIRHHQTLCGLHSVPAPPAPADKTVMRHLEVDFQFCGQQQQSVYCPSCLRQDWRCIILTITLVTSSSSLDHPANSNEFSRQSSVCERKKQIKIQSLPDHHCQHPIQTSSETIWASLCSARPSW